MTAVRGDTVRALSVDDTQAVSVAMVFRSINNSLETKLASMSPPQDASSSSWKGSARVHSLLSSCSALMGLKTPASLDSIIEPSPMCLSAKLAASLAF